MASKFLKRAMEIVKNDAVTTAKGYTSNLLEIKNDAKAVAAQIQQDTTSIIASAQDTYKRIRSGRIVKDISDWFYNSASNEEQEYNEDDFDAGVDFDGLNNDDGDDEEKPSLNIPSSKESSKQIATMYKIGAKQTEAAIANTAELISTFNARSAEIVASIQSVNTSIGTLSEKMDKLIAINTAAAEAAEERQINNVSLVDDNGKITLSRIYETVKQTNKISNNMYVNMAKAMFSATGMMTAEDAFGSLTTMIRDKIKIKDKSINDWGDEFNEFTGALTQRILRGVLDNKYVKKIIGDTADTGQGDTNYGQYRVNKYTNDAAVFDGMTRQTIISIIPGYLKSIDEHLRGRTLNIDKYGQLTTNPEAKDQFVNVTKNAFDGDTFSKKGFTQVTTKLQGSGMDIPDEDIQIAAKALMATYVMYLESSTATTLKPSDISSNDTKTIQYAVRLIRYARGGSYDHWYAVCKNILFMLENNWQEQEKFISNVSRSSISMQKEAISVAQSDYGHLAGKITDEMLFTTFRNSYEGSNAPTIQRTETHEPDMIERALDSKIDEVIGKPINNLVDTISKLFVTTVDSLDKSSTDRIVENGTINTDNAFARVTDAAKSAIDKASETKAVKTATAVVSSILEATTGTKLTTEVTPGSGDEPPKVEVKVENAQPTSTTSPTVTVTTTTETPTVKTPGVTSEGTSTPEETGGETASRPDVIDSARSAVNSVLNVGNVIKSKASQAAHSVTNKAHDVVVDKIEAERDRHRFESAVKEFSDPTALSNVSDQDKIVVQTVMQMAQTATADGEVSNTDLQNIRGQIAQIADPAVKKRLNASIIPMLTRVNNKASTDVNADGSGPKGGIVGKILFGITTAFKTILKPIKSFLMMAWKGVKSFGKQLFSGVIKMFKSGVSDVRSGGRAVSESLFGIKKQVDENGNVISEGEDGLLQQLIINPGKRLGGIVKNIGSAGIDLAKSGFNIAKTGFYAAKDKLTNAEIGSSINTNNETNSEDGSSNKNKASELISKMGDKLKDSDFGKGFMAGFKKEEEAKLKAKLNTPETMTDVKTDSMEQMIEGKKESIFTQIKEGLFKIVEKYAEEESDSESSNKDDTESETSSNETTSSENPTNMTPGLEAPENDDGEGDDGGSLTTTDISTSMSSTDINSSSTGGASAGSKKNGGKLFNIGKMLGGITRILGGLGKMVLSIIMGMSGVKAIMSLVETVLKKSLAPLNKAFQSLYKALKPVVEQLGGIVKQIAVAVTGILEAVIESIKPILEAIGPLIDEIMTLLSPILNILTEAVEVILKPVTAVIQGVVVPILRHIRNIIDLIYGSIETGFGTVQVILGNILKGVGTIISSVTNGLAGNSLKKLGKEWVSQGKEHWEAGTDRVKSALADEWTMFKETFGKDEDKEETTENVEFKYGINTNNGSIMDGTSTSSNGESYIIDNTYGSGDQSSFGGYMNMNKRGCGPIALSDMISRRTGRSVDAYSLASSMANAGMYDSNRGTSVASYINASRSMGVNITPGGVSRESLSMASPRNPITLIGSGSGFDTQNGHNHYVNVVGRSRDGFAMVANPLTGKVRKQPISDLVNNSTLGLYGSGDVDGFSLPDSITDAMSKLKEVAGGILQLFSFGDSSGVDQEVKRLEEEEQYNRANSLLGTDKKGNSKLEAFEEDARFIFEEENPRQKWESDLDYEKRWEKNKKKYLLLAASDTINEVKNKSTIGFSDKVDRLFNSIFKGSYDEEGRLIEDGGLINRLEIEEEQENTSLQNSWVQQGGGYNGKGGEFVSSGGAVLGINYTPEILETDMTQHNGIQHNHSPLHEFFKKMGGDDDAWSENSYENFYKYGNNPNKDGIGSDGRTHNGIDIHTTHDDTRDIPIYATTSGVVDFSGDGGTGGYMTSWIDVAGNRHRILHMKYAPLVKQGQQLEGGKTQLGFIGNTGSSSGYHIHYDIGGGGINPLTYFKYQPPKVTSITSGSKRENMESIWKYLINDLGYTKYGAAGLMGNLDAESGLMPNNLENSHESYVGFDDDGYTNAVNSGRYPVSKFISDHMYAAGCGAGYGLAQWTAGSRKQGLYDLVMGSSHDISNLGDQLRYLGSELQSPYYSGVNNVLKNATDIRTASDKVLIDFEVAGDRYKDSMQRKRAQMGEDIFNQMSNLSLSSLTDFIPKVNVVEDNWDKNGDGAPDINSPGDYELYNKIKVGDYVTVNEGTKWWESGSKNKVVVKEDYLDQPYYVSRVAGDLVVMNVNGKKMIAYRDGLSKTHTHAELEIPALNTVFGSGDVDDFSSAFVGNNILPPPQMPTYQPILNEYNDMTRMEMIQTLSTHTFNVSNKRLEALVERIIEKLDENQANTSTILPTQNDTSSMFSDEIPAQVARLYS